MKNIYEFTKILSALFLLSGICFVASGMYFLAILGIAGFLIIRLADSDWMFDALKVENPTVMVVFITFLLLIVYLCFVYQEMQYDPFISKARPEFSQIYVDYKSELYKAVEPCLNAHNTLQIKKEARKTITQEQIKMANRACIISAANIKKIQVPDKFTAGVKKLMITEKEETRKIALNLGSYKYLGAGTQKNLVKRIQESQEKIIQCTHRAKKIFKISSAESYGPVLVQF